MAWGPRAGSVSFAPILSLVFAMALPPGAQPLWQFALWNAVGGAAYLAWSLASGALGQRRYRTLALVETLGAVADLLRARAELLTAPPLAISDAVHHEAAMQAWVKGEAALAERLQTARDFVFDAPDTAAATRCQVRADVFGTSARLAHTAPLTASCAACGPASAASAK
jgi:FUSC-like inner membrane protein yccS